MDLFSFIRTANPTKVRIGERQRDEDEPKILETIVGRVVPLLPVAPDCSSGELEASVDKLFDEGGSGEQAEQGHSASGEQGVGIQLVSGGEEIVYEDAAPLQPRRQKKQKTVVVDAGEPSHHVKRLRDDHRIPGGTFIDSSHCSGANIAEAEFDSFVRPSILVITAATTITPTAGPATVVKEKIVKPSLSFVDSALADTDPATDGFTDLSDSSHCSGANIAEAEFDSFVRPSVLVITAATTITPTAGPATVVKEKIVKPSLSFVDSALADTDPATDGFTDLSGSDFLIGGIRTVISPDTDLQKHDQLFTEFNVGATRHMSLSVEVRMRAEYNIKENRRLASVVEEKNQLLKSRDEEIKNLKEQLLLKEVEATEAIHLRAEASKLETAEKSLRDEVNALNERNNNLEKEHNALDVKVTDLEAIVVSKERELTNSTAQLTSIKSRNDNLADQLYADFVEMALHLKERFYPYLLTTIVDHRWLFTYDIKLAIAKCLNSSEYLSALGAAISKAIKKGMQDGLAAGITHGKEECELLLTELKLNKDSSVETLMNILRLEETVAERLGLNDSRSHVDQLMIREDIAKYRSALRDVFIPLAEPFSTMALEGTRGTSDTAPATADTTTTLSMVVDSTSTVRPISIDDYEVAGTNDQATANGNVTEEDANPFPNVDDAELTILE
nr:hypothetical protein [Tanacetum cinerariifolium]